MTRKTSFLGGSLALALLAAGMTGIPALPALAQGSLSAEKAAVDNAKSSGVVGEQADGYLGFVRAADANVTAAVNAINAGRRQAYAEAAAKAGVSIDAAAGAAAQQLINRASPGEYVRSANGAWTRK